MTGYVPRRTNNSTKAGFATPGTLNKPGSNSGTKSTNKTIKTAVEGVTKELSLTKEIQTKLVQAVTEAVSSVLRQSFLEIEERLSYQADMIRRQTDELHKLQQYSRRNALRIFGVPETNTDTPEDTDTVVRNIIRSELGVEVQPEEISRSHRVSRKQSPTQLHKNTGPRPIIVKFATYNIRHRVFVQKKKLKGKKVFIWEDLTNRNAKLLAAARRKYGDKNAWSVDGRIFVYDSNRRRKFRITENDISDEVNDTSQYSQVD